MKRLLFFIFVAFPFTFVNAKEAIMRVILQDSTQNDYILSERPKIKFEGGKTTFLYKNMTTNYTTADIQIFVFADPSTGIGIIKTCDTRLFYLENNGDIVVEGGSDKEKIKAFSISGIRQDANASTTSDGVVISIPDLPKGHYIINIGNKQSVKITRR